MRQSFPFHDLSTDEFEDLVRHICMEVLGTGTFAFAPGPDGGRDATFAGTAQKFPSAQSPLTGKFIVQAKHTTNPVGSCSSREFAKVIEGEKPKLKKLIAANEIEHYLVFTNRRKPAHKTIQKEKELKRLGLKTVHVFGQEQLRMWLISHPKIWKYLGYDRFDRRFQIQPQDMTEVVCAFHEVISGDGAVNADNFKYLDKKKKNKLNKLSADYDSYIRRNSLVHFKPIQDFLKNPRNEEFRDLYHDTADEIKQKVIAHSAQFDSFDDVLTYLFDLITEGNPLLRRKRKYVSAFLHYMYYNCDIGQNDPAVQTS